MKQKQSLTVVISAILSLAGATGCSTTNPNVKQSVNYQQQNKSTSMRAAGTRSAGTRSAGTRSTSTRRTTPQASAQQTYNEIYAAAVQLGFDKRTMNTYYQRRNNIKRHQNAQRQKVRQRIARNNWNNRHRAKPKQRVAINRRWSKQQYANRVGPPLYANRVGPPIYARRVVANNRRWIRPVVSRPRVQYRPRVQHRPRAQYRPRVQHRPRVQYRPRIQRRPQLLSRLQVQQRPRYIPQNNRQHYGGGNIWNRVKGGFRLGSELHNPTVQKVLRQYARNPAGLNRTFSRSTEYMHFILYELNRRGMPTEIALLPMVESAFKNRAVSRTGAAGMWQFMPATGRDFGLHRARGFDARMDVFASTKAALTYLQKINREFHGDWYLTLAAYNVGQNRIHRERAKNRSRGLRTDYWSLSLPRETREYVPRLLAYKAILLNPHRYGVRLPAMSNNAVIAQINVNRAINLRQVARMAGLPASTLIRLNPNFKNGITNPRLSRRVVLPRRHAGRLNHAIRNAPTV